MRSTPSRGEYARLNESQSTHLLKIGGGPDTHLGDLAREDAFSEPNVRELVMKYLIIVLVLLLIPPQHEWYHAKPDA